MLPHRLQQLSLELRSASEHLELLDSTGHVPDPLPVHTLLQHTVTAQHLSARTALLADEFAGHLGTRPSEYLSRALMELVTAATHTCAAASLFAQTAHTATPLQPTPGTPDAESRNWRTVLDHATGRGELRRASEAVHSAGRHLKTHRDVERFLAGLRAPAPRTPQNSASRTMPRP
ncbi:hypothetical protein PV416_07995 [Streptomyces ipomoeae]|uniref:hypothetical protein n=1 Tax=Streptomyces ipomoeae TaxID=103232 RepID=UPI0029A38ECC|nr:hypothetical protein [Streptomyces ipomoeae]MDX2821032.1 hypothetical protein [Streptomyces ipomoeae]MDX2874465.1 hypothetical protein [Streptomyces ipomoeae]